ncbi:MAG: adenylate/guanylate cyclase domain-containing protein [Marmoricola sp.]
MTGPDPDSLREHLEEAILGDPPQLTAGEVSDAAGVSIDDARRLWRALGFPDAEGSTAFTEGDARALSLLAEARRRGIGDDAVVRMTRAVGSTMSRLAEWQVSNLVAMYAAGRDTQLRPEESIALTQDLVERLTPTFDDLLVYAWRRHLAAAVTRAEMLQVDETHLTTATIGFADLVRFTALSNELDQEEIGDLVEVFEARCHDVVADRRGRVIKSLGDSVLFVADAPRDALDIALDIIGVIGKDLRLPDVRVGLATGPTVLRMGDVFGPAVNLASRLTGVARRNRVIIDQETAGLLPGEEFETRPLPARPLRGFGDVVPVAVRRTRPRHGDE